MPAIIANARNFLSSSDYPMDKISGYYPGSITVAAGASPTPTVAHGLGYTPLYFVKWSTAPGFTTSYDELGVSTINNLQFAAQTDGTTLYLFPFNNTASSVTFYYRVIYFMPTNVDNDATQTQSGLDNFIQNTTYNYTKVYLEDFVNSGSTTISHGLGYYPQAEAWYIRSSDGRCVHVVQNDVTASTSLPKVQVTTSQLVLTNAAPSTVSSWHYKIYADEV